MFDGYLWEVSYRYVWPWSIKECNWFFWSSFWLTHHTKKYNICTFGVSLVLSSKYVKCVWMHTLAINIRQFFKTIIDGDKLVLGLTEKWVFFVIIGSCLGKKDFSGD